MNIAEFYFDLPRSRKPKFRTKVSDACGWSYGTFYYKLSHGNLSKLERKVVFEIISGYQSSNPAML